MRNYKYFYYPCFYYRQQALSYSFEDSSKCLVTTDIPETNYFIDQEYLKTDISNNQEGIILLLGFKIVDVDGCKNLEGASVDIWHSNAFGEYSTIDNPFLRGTQYSDELGFVEFTSVFPGWEETRTHHINIRVKYNDHQIYSQLFFPNTTNKFIQSQHPYNMREPAPINNSNDPIIYKYDGVVGGWPKVTPFGKRIIATLTIGLDL